MSQQHTPITIGRVELIDLPKSNVHSIPSRIDTGARTSSLWASNIKERNGRLTYTLFGAKSPYYTGQILEESEYSQVVVSSSMGHPEVRYKIKVKVVLHGRKIHASFTLADRSSQTYPILVGRNILRGKFIVDVKRGNPSIKDEKKRIVELQNLLKKEKDNL